MFDPDTATLDECYAQLRRTGTIWAQPDRATSVVAAMRRRAKGDGLRVVASRYTRGLDKWQRRRVSTAINLTKDGIHIVTPDAQAMRDA